MPGRFVGIPQISTTTMFDYFLLQYLQKSIYEF